MLLTESQHRVHFRSVCHTQRVKVNTIKRLKLDNMLVERFPVFS